MTAEIEVYGKVVGRTTYMSKDGKQKYRITLTAGKFESPYEFTTADPEICGPSDGFAAVGKNVTARGFLNSSWREYKRKDGTQGKMVNYYLVLKSLEDTAPISTAKDLSDESVADDIPF